MIKFYSYKKLFLLILFPFVLLETLAQEEYYPLLDTSAVWNYQRVMECEYYTPYYHFDYSLLLDEDTIINGVEYHQLKRPAFEFSTPNWFDGVVEDCGPNPIETGYIGALRENTMERRVYFLPAGDTEESLLYDFSLEEGDTLVGYFADILYEPTMVTLVDSILIGSTYCKRWVISVDGSDTDYSIQYIESIGGLHGLVEPDPFFFMHGPITTLTCYSNGEGIIYPDGDESCMIITHVENEIAEEPAIDVFPNPANGSFTLSHTGAFNAENTFLRVLDIHGRVIKEQTMTGPETIFDTESWPTGMYLLHVKSEEKEIATRVVVQ